MEEKNFFILIISNYFKFRLNELNLRKEKQKKRTKRFFLNDIIYRMIKRQT